MKDGRIHPGRIEEYIEQAKQELANDIKKPARRPCLPWVLRDLIRGLFKFLDDSNIAPHSVRNALLHSTEVGYLATFLAEELKANVAVCKKVAFSTTSAKP